MYHTKIILTHSEWFMVMVSDDSWRDVSERFMWDVLRGMSSRTIMEMSSRDLTGRSHEYVSWCLS